MRQEPKTSLTASPSPAVWTTLGGNGEPASGQASLPSSRTPYSWATPGSIPVTWTRA